MSLPIGLLSNLEQPQSRPMSVPNPYMDSDTMQPNQWVTAHNVSSMSERWLKSGMKYSEGMEGSVPFIFSKLGLPSNVWNLSDEFLPGWTINLECVFASLVEMKEKLLPLCCEIKQTMTPPGT